MAVRNRTVVPLLATYRSASLAGSRPPQPATRIVAAAGSCSTAMPSCRSASIITRVSSLSSAPVSDRLALGQRGADQRPVGDALRSRRADGRPQRTGRLDFDGVGIRHCDHYNNATFAGDRASMLARRDVASD